MRRTAARRYHAQCPASLVGTGFGKEVRDWGEMCRGLCAPSGFPRMSLAAAVKTSPAMRRQVPLLPRPHPSPHSQSNRPQSSHTQCTAPTRKTRPHPRVQRPDAMKVAVRTDTVVDRVRDDAVAEPKIQCAMVVQRRIRPGVACGSGVSGAGFSQAGPELRARCWRCRRSAAGLRSGHARGRRRAACAGTHAPFRPFSCQPGVP